MKKSLLFFILIIILTVFSACSKTFGDVQISVWQGVQKGYFSNELTMDIVGKLKVFNGVSDVQFEEFFYFDVLKTTHEEFKLNGEYNQILGQDFFEINNAFIGLESNDFTGNLLMMSAEYAKECGLSIGDKVMLKYPMSGKNYARFGNDFLFFNSFMNQDNRLEADIFEIAGFYETDEKQTFIMPFETLNQYIPSFYIESKYIKNNIHKAIFTVKNASKENFILEIERLGFCYKID